MNKETIEEAAKIAIPYDESNKNNGADFWNKHKNKIDKYRNAWIKGYEAALSQPKDIESLRGEFFKECTDNNEGLKKVNLAPHDLFNWFVQRLRPKEQPKESELLEALNKMCEESCPPEAFEAWELVKKTLIQNRKLK